VPEQLSKGKFNSTKRHRMTSLPTAPVLPKPCGNGDRNNLDRIRSLADHLGSNILGQPHIIPQVTAALQNGELALTDPARPRGTFLFLGPTGVGKTELTLTFTRHLIGEDHLIRLDMSEY
jgi:ATP-dependent Clp protease ATP-binding subunit ClpA